ncbi:MAG TPA: carboxypeptidase regulatory-like domain-containing protein, partial [Acidimicrobiales bacterium]|nr:carboxypeptidase regulatory-like domain-containing protein [Acidimicrobiales bacterium]
MAQGYVHEKYSASFHKVVAAAIAFVFVATAICVMAVQLRAQGMSAGEIRGTVLDASGAAIPDVRVTIRNDSTGVVTKVTTDTTGVYDAVSLLPGTYSVSFSKAGFRRFTNTNIILHAGAITENATLQVGAVTQHVQVKAGVQLLQTESSSQSATLTDTTMSQLPSVSRNWYNYSFLLPGANGVQGRGGYAGLNSGTSEPDMGFNGQGGYQTLILMNGGNGTFQAAESGLVVPLQAIAEVKVEQSNFGAEYGDAYSSMDVIMKSGTNRFHGEGFEYVQNNDFKARNFFQPSTPPFRWNMYGGTIGGPIKKNKLFFFFGFQNNPIRSYTTGIATYPTLAMRQGNLVGLPQVYDPSTLVQNPDGTYSRTPFAGNQVPVSSAAAAIMKYYPMPNLPGNVNNYYYAAASPSSATVYDWRVDYNISSGNRLDASMQYQNGSSTAQLGPTCNEGIDCEPVSSSAQNDVISDVWTISPTMVNEFRESFVRSYGSYLAKDVGKNWGSILGIAQLTAPTFPGITISGTAAPDPIGTGFKHSVLGNANITEADTLTMIKGRHILKFGGEFDDMRYNQSWADINAGGFNFSGQFTNDPQNPSSTGLGFADFLLGQPASWSDSWTPAWGLRIRDVQAFAQDDYKITPHLTLNLGLRWIGQGGYTEQFNRVGSFDPTLMNPATGTLGAMWYGGQLGRKALQGPLWKNFEPRLGFAWSPKPNWVVRGGYGIF